MMMKFKLLLGVCFLTVFACNTSTQQSENGRSSMKEDGLTTEENELKLQEDKSTSTKQMIGQILDSTYSDSTDFNQLFDCYIFSFDGATEKVADTIAIALYHQILDTSKEDLNRVPVFETKDAKKAILLTKEKGILANVLIDKADRSILNLQFHTKSKTSDLGAKQQIFRKQFIGTTVNFSENNFGLKPWDKEKGTGDIQIDGISGATDICQATVEMLNGQLQLHQNYFEK